MENYTDEQIKNIIRKRCSFCLKNLKECASLNYGECDIKDNGLRTRYDLIVCKEWHDKYIEILKEENKWNG